jgi:predicted CoA-binding protein
MNAPDFPRQAARPVAAQTPVQWLASTRDLINEFLRQKRIAIVGVSRKKSHFSRAVLTEFRKRGYDVVPCNPHESTIDELTAFPNVQSIRPPVDAVLVMTPPEVTESIVKECQQAGVTRIWLHRGTGMGASSSAAIAFCLSHNMKVIAGHCPLMFLSDAHLVHRIHGWFKKLARTYPN